MESRSNHLCCSDDGLVSRGPELCSVNFKSHEPLLLPPVLVLQQQVAAAQLLQFVLDCIMHTLQRDCSCLVMMRATAWLLAMVLLVSSAAELVVRHCTLQVLTLLLLTAAPVTAAAAASAVHYSACGLPKAIYFCSACVPGRQLHCRHVAQAGDLPGCDNSQSAPSLRK